MCLRTFYILKLVSGSHTKLKKENHNGESYRLICYFNKPLVYSHLTPLCVGAAVVLIPAEATTFAF